MKKQISILIIIALAVLTLCSCNSKGTAKNEGYTLYRSSPVGVEIEYPSFWEMADNQKEKSVAFGAPNEGFADKFRDNVTVLCEEIGSDDLAFDNYINSYIAQLPANITKYNHVSEQEMTVAGCRAYRVLYEGSTNEVDLRIEQTFISSGKYIYIYTFMAEPSSFAYFKMNSDVMLGTFKPLNK